MENITNNLIKHWIKAFALVLESYKTNRNIDHISLELFTRLISKISRWRAHRGDLWTITRIKEIRVRVQKITANDTFSPVFGLSVYKDGLPTALGRELADLIKKRDKDAVRMLLTCLQISYTLPAWKAPSIDTIIQPSEASDDILSDIIEWFKENEQLVIKTRPKPYWTKPHTTTKAGPLGPAATTSADELPLIDPDLRRDLEILGGFRFATWFDNCLGAQDYLIDMRKKIFPLPSDKLGGRTSPDSVTKSISRLSIVRSPEGKSRVIAIFDYWSQTVLKELHKWSFDQLRKLPTDLTFNQGDFKSKPLSGPFYSFDLSAATDRFPVSLQRSILAVMMGEEKASAWARILTNRSFTTSWMPGTFRYGAGQPMGAYSSWGVFSLCHHIIVQYSAWRAGFRQFFNEYYLLGDDIVIAHPEVAKEYLAVTTALGVKINLDKSLVSPDTFEFAKRFFIQGEEVTAFPLAAIMQNSKDVSALWSVMTVARERGYTFCHPYAVPGLVAALQRAFGTFFRSTQRKAKDLEALSVIANRSKFQDEFMWALNHIHSFMNRPVSCHGTIDAKARELFYDLGYFAMKHKALLLENCYKRFNELSSRVTGGSWLTTGIEGTVSQYNAPIDLMRVPIVWILRVSTENQETQANDLKAMTAAEAWEDLVRLSVSPVGDVNKIISRQTNLHAIAQASGFTKFLVKEQANLNRLIQEELNSESTSQWVPSWLQRVITGDIQDWDIPTKE